jgi:hypothetical protein
VSWVQKYFASIAIARVRSCARGSRCGFAVREVFDPKCMGPPEKYRGPGLAYPNQRNRGWAEVYVQYSPVG